jgi:transposase, IS5 family
MENPLRSELANRIRPSALARLRRSAEKIAAGVVARRGAQGVQGAAIRRAAARAQDMTSRRVRYKNLVDELQKGKNRVKARVRAKVEHPFRILKRIFGFEKVRYRGIQKNHHRLCASFALVNLYLHRKRLAVARA